MFKWTGTGAATIPMPNKANRMEVTVDRIAPVTSKEKNIHIPPRKGQRTFWCDITGNFDGPSCFERIRRTALQPVPLQSSFRQHHYYSQIQHHLPFHDWSAKPFVTEPFVLTYTNDGFFWSQSEPVR